MMMPLPQYYAKELHDSMRGSATDNRLIIEVLCTLSNDEIKMIKQAYNSKYSRSLEYDISGDTTGSFKDLMFPLFIADRDELFDLDPAEAQEDARALIGIGDLSFGSKESTFLKILVERSFTQLQQIFIDYESMAGHGIEKAIENQYSGDIKDRLLFVIKCLRNSPVFFAEQFYKTVQGPEIDDKELIRLIVTRSEIDMREIKEAFVELYNESLENYISEDCYGCYKECLITLIS
ncbi:annexin B9-like [Neodiprion virginianus]|uniref:annexin B9-like n=1 Tax=Neodiprion virginianus TaxID=2961670 RepID=UPI001EE71A54|nr:annexin B9-like [Neodiprion virginianus]XP_046617245.1 annexin B9-like [Neodiprion virginianus]XP_046617246.1 annexin B9-like [Neodiprion virginianus]